jgi:hypothetical protein
MSVASTTRRVALVPAGREDIDVLLALKLGARLYVRIRHGLCRVAYHEPWPNLPQVDNVYYLLRMRRRG